MRKSHILRGGKPSAQCGAICRNNCEHMNIPFEDISTILALFVSGGGLGVLITWRYKLRQEKATTHQAEAEAMSAENNATKEVQDIYQELIEDIKRDRDEQKAYITELKDDRQHLRLERDELRDRIDETDKRVRELQVQVTKNEKMVESMRPFMCGRMGCPNRTLVLISADGECKPTKSKPKPEIK